MNIKTYNDRVKQVKKYACGGKRRRKEEGGIWKNSDTDAVINGIGQGVSSAIGGLNQQSTDNIINSSFSAKGSIVPNSYDRLEYCNGGRRRKSCGGRTRKSAGGRK